MSRPIGSFLVLLILATAMPSIAFAVGKAADATCPKEDNTHRYSPSYEYPKTYINYVGGKPIKTQSLFRKPCEDSFVKAFCTSPNFCNAEEDGSKCFANGKWIECKALSADTLEKFQNGTPPLTPLSIEGIQKALQGETGGLPQQPTQDGDKSPSPQGSLFQQLLNPTPLSQQQNTPAPSGASIDDFIRDSMSSGLETPPGQAASQPFDPDFLSKNHVQLTEGNLPGITSSEVKTIPETGGSAGTSYFQPAGGFSGDDGSGGNPFDSGGQRGVYLTCQGGGGFCGPDSTSAAAGGTPLTGDMRGIAVPRDNSLGLKIGDSVNIQGVNEPVPVTDYTKTGSSNYVVSGAVEKELGGVGRDPVVISPYVPAPQLPGSAPPEQGGVGGEAKAPTGSFGASAGLEQTLKDFSRGYEGNWALSTQQNADLAEQHDWARIAQAENAAKQAEVDSYVNQQLSSVPLPEPRTNAEILYDLNRREILAQAQLDYENSQATGYPIGKVTSADLPPAEDLKQIQQQIVADRKAQAPEAPQQPTLAEQFKSWWSGQTEQQALNGRTIEPPTNEQSFDPYAGSSAEWARVAQDENLTKQVEIDSYVNQQLNNLPISEQPTDQQIAQDLSSPQVGELYPGESLEKWTDVAQRENATKQAEVDAYVNQQLAGAPLPEQPTAQEIADSFGNSQPYGQEFNEAFGSQPGEPRSPVVAATGDTRSVVASTYGWDSKEPGDSPGQKLAFGGTRDQEPWGFALKPQDGQKLGMQPGDKALFTYTDKDGVTRSVVGKWDDTGPFVAGRTVDLNKAVAEELGLGKSVGTMSMTPVSPDTPLGPASKELAQNIQTNTGASTQVAENVPLPQSRPITADLSSIADKLDSGGRLTARDIAVLNSAANRSSFISKLPEDQRTAIAMYSGMIKQMGSVQASLAINLGPYAQTARTMIRDGLRSVLGR